MQDGRFISQVEGGFQGIGQPRAISCPNQAVDHHFNRMLALLIQVQRDCLVQIHKRAVEADPRVASFFNLLENVLMLPFAISDKRSENHHLGIRRVGAHLLHHACDGLAGNFFAANRTMRRADTGK